MSMSRDENGEVQQNHDELKTRQINRYKQSQSPDSDDPKTQVNFNRSSTPDERDDNHSSTPDERDENVDTSDAMSNPVVGWLIIVKGPGKGHALQLGYGLNSIGRNLQERVCLNFGDKDISRSKQAIVTYDPRGKKFFVQHGEGKNLTYLGEQPLLAPVELHSGENISAGQTTLRFVPLCGENFDWQNNS